MLVHHFLENSAKRLPEKVALICDDQRLTYREINSSADQLAAALFNMGVRRQDRIVIFLDNSAGSVISLFGILKAGAIFIMVNPTMKSKKLNYILNDSGACTLITQSTKSRIVRTAIDDVPNLRNTIWLGKSNQLPKESPSTITFHLWKELFPLTSDLRPLTSDLRPLRGLSTWILP